MTSVRGTPQPGKASAAHFFGGGEGGGCGGRRKVGSRWNFLCRTEGMGRAKRPLLRSEPISTSSFIGDLSYRVEMLDALEIRQRDEDLAKGMTAKHGCCSAKRRVQASVHAEPPGWGEGCTVLRSLPVATARATDWAGMTHLRWPGGSPEPCPRHLP